MGTGELASRAMLCCALEVLWSLLIRTRTVSRGQVDGRDAITKTFQFDNFNQAWGFMSRTALHAEEVGRRLCQHGGVWRNVAFIHWEPLLRHYGSTFVTRIHVFPVCSELPPP